MTNIYGGAVSERIEASAFAPWPYFEEDEIEAAVAVLRSGKVNYWTGTEGRKFENEFSHSAGCKYGVAVANGTVALELALRALGIGPGDEVVTTSRTFLATASSIVAVGAKPLFADVDRDSQNITAASIRSILTPATKAVIAVHLAGLPCEMDEINELANEFGLFVIEDCAQAHGATFKERPVGSLGHIGTFSFCQDKIITTAGEGGMVTTNSEDLWRRMWSYKDHGKDYDAVHHRMDPWGFRWLHESFGTNWRLSEVQSAVGRVALRKMPFWISKRRRNAKKLTERLSQLPALRIGREPEHLRHSYYKYYAFVQPEKLKQGWSRDRIAKSIVSEGVPCSVGSCSEVYLEGAFPPDLRPPKRLAIARELGETSLMFVVHPTLSEAAIERTCETVERVVAQATWV
ncbi:MAG: DegT/DnrJ/EryC1/StrS aminotransferase family protein [Terracidiphilus sp.]|jgi:dTDP-4-amino-4,6-dideoxygalactose transaminase